MAVLGTRTALVVATVDQFGGSLAVGLESAQNAVVYLAKQDLAAVRAGWVVARQVDPSYHPRLILPGEIDRHLDCGA